MQAQGLIAKPMKNGRWKVRVWGTTDEHFGDWCGCNGRIRTAPDQPHAGFETIAEANAYTMRVFPFEEDCVAWAEKTGNGASATNADFEGSVEVDKHWYGHGGLLRRPKTGHV